jgi:hypothetical protein
MSGSLSAAQMGALPGLRTSAVGLDPDDEKRSRRHPHTKSEEDALRKRPITSETLRDKKARPNAETGDEVTPDPESYAHKAIKLGAGEGPQTGAAYQDWKGGETNASLRAGNLSTTSRNMSFAMSKGPIPMSASKGTLGSLLYAADEGLTDIVVPEAVGTMYQKER